MKLFGNYQHVLRNEFNENEGSSGDVNEISQEESQSEVSGDESSEDLSASSEVSTVEELEGEIEQAVAEGASEAEIKSMIKKFQLKVNGKEREVEIDLSDEEAVKRELQKSMAFSEKAKEANELKKAYQDALNELMNDPISVLASLGVNVDELSSKHILNKIEEEQKTPEQKEQERLTRELESYRKQIQKIEAEKKAAEETAQAQKALMSLEKELDEAWGNANIVIPKNPKFISRVADAMDWVESQVDEITGKPLYPNVTIAQILPMVQDDYFAEMADVMNNAPEEALSKYNLSKAVAKQVEKKASDIKKAPTNVSNLNKATAQSKQVSSEPKKSERRVSARDFFDNLK